MRTTRSLSVAGSLLALVLLAGCGEDAETTGESTGESAAETGPVGDATPPADVSCDYAEDGSEPARDVDAPESDLLAGGTVALEFDTSVGTLSADLDAEAAPCTVNNLVSLERQGWFDDTVCHRLTTDGIYVLQCGDPSGDGRGGPGYTIPDELTGEETYEAGTIAMANTGWPDTGGSQFFLVYEDSVLAPSYTVFGMLDEESVQLLQEVAADGTEDGGPDGAPATEVRINGVTTR